MSFRLNRFKRKLIESPFSADLIFPEGLIGFEELKNFTLIGKKQELPFLWLEHKETDASFVVIDPYKITTDYEVHVTEADLKYLNIESENQLFLLTIVNTKRNPFTANLSAPLLIDWSAKMGKQIVVMASGAHPIDSTIF